MKITIYKVIDGEMTLTEIAESEWLVWAARGWAKTDTKAHQLAQGRTDSKRKARLK